MYLETFNINICLYNTIRNLVMPIHSSLNQYRNTVIVFNARNIHQRQQAYSLECQTCFVEITLISDAIFYVVNSKILSEKTYEFQGSLKCCQTTKLPFFVGVDKHAVEIEN